MLLAAISGIMKRALLDIAPKDLDEVIVIVPDTNKEELEHFQNFIYGHNFEKQPFAPKLFELLQIENPSLPKDFLIETNTELHMEDLESLNEEPIFTYGISNIKKLKKQSIQHKNKKEQIKLNLTEVREILKNDPGRVGERKSEGNSEVWEHFKMLAVDDIPVPFAKCSNCETVLIHSSKCGTSTLRKHIQTHIKDKRGENLNQKFLFK